MGKISDAEVRRLVSHLKGYIDDEELANIENELREETAEEFLIDQELLKFFPEISDEFSAEGKKWKIRVISHAHLRMVQRGIKLNDVSTFFRAFGKQYAAEAQTISVGNYALFGRLKSRSISVTVRIEINSATDDNGDGHVVTVYVGRGNTEGMTKVDLPPQ